ncbi:MAG: thiamine phosphate synthase [Parvibaculales bacterium]
MLRHPPLPTQFFFSDRQRVADWAGVCLALPRGAGVVLRDYHASNRAAMAADMAQLCRDKGLALLIAGDPELAVRHKAGLHCPEMLMPRLRRSFAKIRAANPAALITGAAHSPRAIHAAAHAGLDAVFVSPVFATLSGLDKRPLGPVKTAHWTTNARLPVLALGGMSMQAVRRLQHAGHHGYAAIGDWQAKLS